MKPLHYVGIAFAACLLFASGCIAGGGTASYFAYNIGKRDGAKIAIEACVKHYTREGATYGEAPQAESDHAVIACR